MVSPIHAHPIPRTLLSLAMLLSVTSLACEKPAQQPAPSANTADASPTAQADPAAPPAATPKAEDKPAATASDTSAALFDLVDNRHLAHLNRPGLWIEPGNASALKYVQGRWKNPWYDAQDEGGQRFAYVKGVGATLRMPLGMAGQEGKTDETWLLRANVKPAGDQRCDVFLSPADGPEQKIASWTIKADTWNELEAALPTGLALGKDVSVRFHFSKSQSVGDKKSAAAFSWLYLGPKREDYKSLATTKVFEQDKIKLGAQEAITWHVLPPAGAQLVLPTDAEVEVELQAQDQAIQKLSATPQAHTLSFSHELPTRLTIRAKASAVTLTKPRLVHPQAKAPSQLEHAAPAPPKVVLVWLIDTLRSDHLEMYNAKSDVQTPNLSAWAKEAAVFERASVQGNSSLPSSASIFSSSYPSVHNIVTEKAKLKESQTLLGQAIKALDGGAKWRTGLFSSNGYVSNSWGFARGFDKETNPIREGSPSKAEYLWPAAKTWLEAQLKASKDEPVFVYLNTSDPHVPYDPPAEDLKLYHQGGAVGKVSPRGTGQLLHDIAEGKVKLSGPEIAYMRALYKGAITYNDRWFGQMLKDLEALGVRDQTMIVVTSDHGEEFGEHERFGHGISLFQELVDVPFIVGYTPWTKGGARIGQAVEMIDMYPTIMDALGAHAKIPQSAQGYGLGAWLNSPAAARYPTTAFSYHNDFLIGARIGDWKYLLFQGDKDPVHKLSYTDIAKANPSKPDSVEGPDLREKAAIARRMMRDMMAFHVRYDQAWNKRADGWPNNHSATLAKRLDEQGW